MGFLSQFKHLKITGTNHKMLPQSVDNKTVIGSGSTYETVEGSHEYMIRGYSLAKGRGVGKYMKSVIFPAGGYKWVVYFYPDGYDQANKEYVSLFISLVGLGAVRASFEFKLLDQSGQGIHSPIAKLPPNIRRSIFMWGWKKFIKRSDLEASSYLKDDCLSIHCTIGVVQKCVRTVQTRIEEGKNYIIPVPPSDLSQNLKDLLESETGSDVTFQVGNESFRAHKWILAARSPVFKAQFSGSVGDSNMETVVVQDLDPIAFQAMLIFSYSDEFPEASELFDSEFSSTTFTQNLLAAADRYDLARLKLMCEAKLCEEITATTVATTLALAEQYQCLHLKPACLNFAAKPEILEEVMKSNGYTDLEKSYPLLLTELLKTSAVVKKNEA